MEKPRGFLSIFISYGHEKNVKEEKTGELLFPEPNNEDVILKLMEFLRNRGHEVWFDKDNIREGDDWRAKITAGILSCDIALICLTPKAMVPGGVCRDEINIAIGVRSGSIQPIFFREMNPGTYPSRIMTRQTFDDLKNWHEHWTCDKDYDSEWFNMEFEKLALILESKEMRDFSEDMKCLSQKLHPISSEPRLQEMLPRRKLITNPTTNEWENEIQEEVTLGKFIGRASLFQHFEDCLERAENGCSTDDDRFFWFCKGPGFGKSRFAAELTDRYRYAIPAIYFIDYRHPNTLVPQNFICSIAYQLAQMLPAYRTILMEALKKYEQENLFETLADTLFQELITQPLFGHINGNMPHLWILVDALDEATSGDENPIAELIGKNLSQFPEWIHFVVTSRPDDAINQLFSPRQSVDFPDDENEIDVKAYIRRELEIQKIPVSEDLVETLFEKSDGLILYAEMVFKDLKS